MTHVIIGVGAAGITAAKTIRELEPDARIATFVMEKFLLQSISVALFYHRYPDEVNTRACACVL